MIRSSARIVMTVLVVSGFALAAGRPALSQEIAIGATSGNVNKVFASGSITGIPTSEPLTGILIPDKTLFQVQVYKNTYGLIMGRLSYTDADFNMISSSRVKVQSLTTTQAKLVFLVTYKATTDLLYVTLSKITLDTGPAYQVTFECTDGYGKAYPDFGRSALMDPTATLILTP
jgi:hypothetical protein